MSFVFGFDLTFGCCIGAEVVDGTGLFTFEAVNYTKYLFNINTVENIDLNELKCDQHLYLRATVVVDVVGFCVTVTISSSLSVSSSYVSSA